MRMPCSRRWNVSLRKLTPETHAQAIAIARVAIAAPAPKGKEHLIARVLALSHPVSH